MKRTAVLLTTHHNVRQQDLKCGQLLQQQIQLTLPYIEKLQALLLLLQTQEFIGCKDGTSYDTMRCRQAAHACLSVSAPRRLRPMHSSSTLLPNCRATETT